MFNNMNNELELKYLLKILEERMKSLIYSTVSMDVKLSPGKEWKFTPEKTNEESAYETSVEGNVINYATEGVFDIASLTEWEIMGLTLHEISHAKYTGNIDLISTQIPEPKREYISFFNCIEDIRIERKLMDRYPGSYDSFSRIADKEQELINEEDIGFTPQHINFLLNLRQKEWKKDYYFKDDEVKQFFYDNEQLFEDAYNLNSTQKLHDYSVNKLWDLYSKLIPPPVPEMSGDSEQQQDQNDEQDDEQQEGGGGSSGQGEENEDQQEGGGGSDNGEQEDKDNQDGDQDQENDKQDKDQEKDQEKNPPKEPETPQQKEEHYKNAFNNVMELKELVNELIKHSGKESTHKGQSWIDQIKNDEQNQRSEPEQRTAKATVQVSKADEDKIKGHDMFKTYEELYADIKPNLSYFKRKLKSIMVDNQILRKGGSYKSGKLNTKILHKWKCGNYKLFGRPIHRNHKNYAVTLLIDESASMFYDNTLSAAQSSVLLSEVLHHVGIPFEIRGFNESERIYKTFNQPFNWTIKRNLEKIIPAAQSWGCGATNDAFAVNWAMSHLKQQDSENMLIVLTDGSPNPTSGSIPKADKKRLKGHFTYYNDFNLGTEVMKAKQFATVIGIGIKAPYVKESYPQHVVCDDVSELPRLILKLIKKYVKRG